MTTDLCEHPRQYFCPAVGDYECPDCANLGNCCNKPENHMLTGRLGDLEMNRLPNPYRDEHRRLQKEGNAAAGRGDYAECTRLWREAARLQSAGWLDVEAAIRRSKTVGTLDEVDAAALRMFNETSTYLTAFKEGKAPDPTAMAEATKAYSDAVDASLKDETGEEQE